MRGALKLRNPAASVTLRMRQICSFRPVRAAVLALLALPGMSVHAGGSADAGKAKATVCAACHGVDGNSLNPEWPSLAGQHETYILKSLKAFKGGTRKNVLMVGQVAALTEQDMQDLATYFAGEKRQNKTADPKLLTSGERLYRGGNKESGVSACLACHGPNGRGNQPAGYPAIGGQHATYTAAQLRAYRAAERESDPNQMMRNVAARLTDSEINAVASYIQGLR
jgi:cytochrome c553